MKANNFLITGLPRSRTAWMAAYFSNYPAICHHEPLKMLSEISEFPGSMHSEFYPYVGASDSGAGFFLPWIMKNMNPPTVIIERDIDEVERSMALIGFEIGKALDMLRERLLTFKNHPSVLWVPFDSLNDKRIIRRIHSHLLPCVPFDDVRYEIFSDLRIEADVSRVVEIAERRKSEQAHMMRDVLKELQSCPG